MTQRSTATTMTIHQARRYLEQRVMTPQNTKKITTHRPCDSHLVLDVLQKYPSLNQEMPYLLHHVLRHSPSVELVRYIVDQNKNILSTVDQDLDWTPLHFACQNQCSFVVVDFLVSRYPKALSVSSYFGGTPLQLACQQRVPTSPQVLRLLAKTFPQALVMGNDRLSNDGFEDNDSIMPLDSALANQFPAEHIQALLEHYPKKKDDAHKKNHWRRGDWFSNKKDSKSTWRRRTLVVPSPA